MGLFRQGRDMTIFKMERTSLTKTGNNLRCLHMIKMQKRDGKSEGVPCPKQLRKAKNKIPAFHDFMLSLVAVISSVLFRWQALSEWEIMNDCHFIHKAKFLLWESYLRLFYLYTYQLFSFQLFLFSFRLCASSCLYNLISFPIKQRYEEQPESLLVKGEVGKG